MGPTFTNPSGSFDVVFVGICVFGVIVVLLAIFLVVRNVAKARKSGIDPFTVQTDLAARVMNSDLLSAEKSVPERLAEVDSLLASGTISTDEHKAARAAILAGR